MSITRLGKRVLLVDDDEQILQTVQVALQESGYEVLIARDGAEGLIRAERDAPDLIILDVVMPRRSGFTVLHRLHHRRLRGPRIILMTANGERRYHDYARSQGVDAFLAKPFEMTELLEEVDTLLECRGPA